MKRWEYKVEVTTFPPRLGATYAEEVANWLNAMDECGWELVAVSSIHSMSGIDMGNCYYFKKWRE